MDNIFIEYEGRSTCTADRWLQAEIGGWLDFYNTERPHSALASQTPAEAYGAERPVGMPDKANALPLRSNAR